MILRREILQRVLLAKSILSSARAVPLDQPSAHLVAKQVLNAHDAADLVFAAIADHQNKLPAADKMPPMLKCLHLIDTPGEKYAGYFSQLNDARNGLKHAGNLPNTTQWASVGAEVSDKLSTICRATLRISLKDIDESELLANDEARKYLSAAKAARDSGRFKEALEDLAKALDVSLDSAPDVGMLQVGRANVENALRLTAYGVSANEFLRLQELLPRVFRISSEHPFTVSWRQSAFGHPGNWNEQNLDFCIKAYLNIALSVQDAPPIPHAISLWEIYDYRVEALEDNVEVWEDLVENPLDHVHGDNVRPTRTHDRYLRKGASIVVSSTVKPFISEDESLDGKPIERVMVSNDLFSHFIGGADERAKFVNRTLVSITCVPKSLYRSRFPELPEIPWEEDQADHS